jgi:hypothetical protein
MQRHRLRGRDGAELFPQLASLSAFTSSASPSITSSRA